MAKDDPKQTLSMYLSVTIRPSAPQYGAQGDLRVEESFEFPTTSFTEICRILGQFHDLAEKIRAEQKN
jgi:hypothetical protein